MKLQLPVGFHRGSGLPESLPMQDPEPRLLGRKQNYHFKSNAACGMKNYDAVGGGGGGVSVCVPLW